MTIVYEIIHDGAGLEALRAEWDGLWTTVEGEYPDSHEFVTHVLRHVVVPGGRHLACVVGRESGSLRFLWPLSVGRTWGLTQLSPVGSGSADESRWLAGPGEEEQQLAEAWRFVVDQTGADLTLLPNLREGSPLHRVVRDRRSPSTGAPRTILHDRDAIAVAHWRDDSVWASHQASRFSKNAAKGLRRLGREGEVQVRFLAAGDDDSTSAETVEWMLEHKRRWSERTGKSSPFLESRGFQDYLVDSMTGSRTEPSRTRMLLLSVDSTPVAAAVFGVGSTVTHGIFLSHDERFATFSPGSLLIHLHSLWAREQRLDLDLSVGNEPYKLQITRGVVCPVVNLRVSHTARGRAGVALLELKRHLGGVVRRSAPGRALFSLRDQVRRGADAEKARPRGGRACSVLPCVDRWVDQEPVTVWSSRWTVSSSCSCETRGKEIFASSSLSVTLSQS